MRENTCLKYQNIIKSVDILIYFECVYYSTGIGNCSTMISVLCSTGYQSIGLDAVVWFCLRLVGSGHGDQPCARGRARALLSSDPATRRRTRTQRGRPRACTARRGVRTPRARGTPVMGVHQHTRYTRYTRITRVRYFTQYVNVPHTVLYVYTYTLRTEAGYIVYTYKYISIRRAEYTVYTLYTYNTYNTEYTVYTVRRYGVYV